MRQLRLFLDKDGFILCGGRIHNAPLDQLAKFPYLLAPKHPFTSLIVYSTHEKHFHAGVDCTLTAIRQEYWIGYQQPDNISECFYGTAPLANGTLVNLIQLPVQHHYQWYIHVMWHHLL